MDFRKTTVLSLLMWLLAPTLAAATVQRAVAINDQRLYRQPRVESKVVGRLTIGEEVTVTGRQGALLEVLLPNKAAGWTLANGLVVLDDNSHGAALLYEAADVLAQEGSAESWLGAARLFRKVMSLDANGPYAADAAFRAAELAGRAEINATGAVSPKGSIADLNAVVRTYPKSRAAAHAAFLLLRNSLCEYWEGSPGCPEAEIGLISNYLKRYPDSPEGAEAHYAIAYRHAALVEIYLEKDKPQFSPEKAVEHKTKAREAVENLLRLDPGGAWAARGERLLWSLQNNVGVYSALEVALRKF